MLGKVNQKILGAVVIGMALVAGAYTISTFGQPRMQPAAVNIVNAPARVAVDTSDTDNNGIEDWRDEFTVNKAVIASVSSTTYELPTTLTGRLGIQFLQDSMRAKNSGPFARSQEEVVADTVENIALSTTQELYDTSDVSIMNTWTEEDIKNYANAMASVILTNNVANLGYELDILNEVLNNNKPEKMSELVALSQVYKRTRDDSLNIPVPVIFLKQHLDLINSYTAIEKDIEGMLLSQSDPVVALMRIKRYQDDARGLNLSFQNMYKSFEPYASLFSANDPAAFFSNFNPANNRIQ